MTGRQSVGPTFEPTACLLVWVKALAAGTVGFGALLALLGLAARLVRLPAGLPISTPAEMPVITAVLLLVMASVVAGVSALRRARMAPGMSA